MKSQQSPTEFDKNNRDVSSIRGYVMEKNSSRMPNMDLLNDKECTTRLERCCKKLVKKSTEAIHPYLHDGTTTTHWVDREGYNAIWQNCHGEYVVTKAERVWLCSSEKRLQEIARRTHGKDSTRLLNHSSQSTKKDSEKDKSLRELKSDLPTASSTSTNWDGNNYKTSSWNSKHSSWSDGSWFFLRVRTSFGWLEKNFQTTDGVCEQNTRSNSMYRCAQCVTTHTEQNDHISSREHAWLKIANL